MGLEVGDVVLVDGRDVGDEVFDGLVLRDDDGGVLLEDMIFVLFIFSCWFWLVGYMW